jgi:hypothetical protein
MPKVEERAPEQEPEREPEQDQKPRARAPVPRLSVGTDLVDEHEGAGGD